MGEQIKKENQDPSICCLQETHFSVKDAQRLTKGIEKDTSMQMETKRNLGQLFRKNRGKPKTVTTKLLYKDKGDYPT